MSINNDDIGIDRNKGKEEALPIKLNDPSISNVPIQIDQLEFEGLERTDKEFLFSIVKNCRNSRTLGELQESLSSSMEIINRLDLFKEVDVILDSHTVSSLAPNPITITTPITNAIAATNDTGIINENSHEKNKDKINLRFQVKEKRFKIQAGTEMRFNEAGLNAGGIFYNIFGKGECLEASGSMGMQHSSPLLIKFSKPVVYENSDKVKIIHWWNTSLHNQLQNYLDGLFFRAKKWGISTCLEFTTKNSGFVHEISVGHDWRTIYGVKEDSSCLIKREESVPNNRAFISHVMTQSTRDQNVFPTRGYFQRWLEELIWFNSTPLIKSEWYGQAHHSLNNKLITFNMSGRIRHLYNPTGGRTCILDRFQLGGPTSIRGFYLNGLGPRDRDDSLGGDFSFESGLQITFPFNKGTMEILRGHLFLNGGFLTNLTVTQDRIFNLISRNNGIRGLWNSSIGGGLIIKLGDQAKLELNLAYPIHQEKDVKFTRGIQLGLGLEFL